jgi:TonB family protein
VSEAQQVRMTYFDNERNEVKAPKTAMYYREVFERNDTTFAKDFFISGALQMTGSFLDKRCEIKHGPFFYYNEQGIKTAGGLYNKGLKEGEWNYWTESGDLSNTNNFEHDSLNGYAISYYSNGKMWSRSFFEKGIETNTTTWNDKGELLEGKKETFVESMPEFPGGQDAMVTFLINNINYPKDARRKKIEGKVILQFNISIDGSISNVVVVKSVNELLDDEAVRVIKQMPLWKPGYQNAKQVTVRYTLPIMFRL